MKHQGLSFGTMGETWSLHFVSGVSACVCVCVCAFSICTTSPDLIIIIFLRLWLFPVNKEIKYFNIKGQSKWKWGDSWPHCLSEYTTGQPWNSEFNESCTGFSVPRAWFHACIFDEAIRRRAVHMTVHHLLTLFYLFAPGDSKVSLMMAL